MANFAADSQHDQRRHYCSRQPASANCFVKIRPPSCQRASSSSCQVLAMASQQNKEPMIAAGAVPLLAALYRSGQPDA